MATAPSRQLDLFTDWNPSRPDRIAAIRAALADPVVTDSHRALAARKFGHFTAVRAFVLVNSDASGIVNAAAPGVAVRDDSRDGHTIAIGDGLDGVARALAIGCAISIGDVRCMVTVDGKMPKGYPRLIPLVSC